MISRHVHGGWATALIYFWKLTWESSFKFLTVEAGTRLTRKNNHASVAVFQVLGISFSPNGYHLATGSEDNTCRIWDLRKKKSLYIIPAHSHLISQVKFEPQEGYFLATASYDTTAKVFVLDFRPTIRGLFWHMVLGRKWWISIRILLVVFPEK